MERERPKTVRELFKGTDPKAECADATKPIHHVWYVFRPDGPPMEPQRVLYVLCRDCGADGIIRGCADHEWEWAEAALEKPVRLPLNQRHRVKDMHPRRPEAWYDLTLTRYGEPPDD